MAASGRTQNYLFPFPLSADVVDVSGDIELLARNIDTNINEIIQDVVGLLISSSNPTSEDPTTNVGINVFYRDSTGKINFALDTNYLQDTVASILDADHIGLTATYNNTTNKILLEVTGGGGGGGGTSNASLSDMWWLGV
jgi:hypothetical protein